MAAHSRKKGEELKAQKSEGSQYYGIGAVLAVGVIGELGYYLYQAKKGEDNVVSPPLQPQPNKQPSTRTNKFQME